MGGGLCNGFFFMASIISAYSFIILWSCRALVKYIAYVTTEYFPSLPGAFFIVSTWKIYFLYVWRQNILPWYSDLTPIYFGVSFLTGEIFCSLLLWTRNCSRVLAFKLKLIQTLFVPFHDCWFSRVSYFYEWRRYISLSFL